MLNGLPDFSKASVLVIGDVMLDRYWFGDTARISPEAPVPVVKVDHTDDRLGGAANVALNIAALGAKVTLLGVAGNDENATRLIEHLNTTSIQHHIQCFPNTPTITKLRVVSRHQQLIRLDFEENFSDFNSDELIAIYKKKLQDCNLVILSDYQKGTLVEAQQFIQLAKQANIPVLVDPKGKEFTLYSGADVITPNIKEFEIIVGSCEKKQDMLKKGRDFLRQHDIKALLLTRGEFGMTLILRDRDELLHLPAHAREVFDVTGAGDTVIGVLGAAFSVTHHLPEAMALANLAASLVVAKLGTATVSASELQLALAQSSAPLLSSVLEEDQLALVVSEARIRGKKVVLTNGCFDILHAGHVTYLQQAKQLGDYLIVAVNDDASVAKLKGADRPINSVMHRMAVLAGLGAVDWVTSFSDDTPERLLKKLQPDILVKGGDYTINEVVGSPIVQAYGGEVRVLGCVDELSTSRIIDRVIKNTKT